MEEWVGQWWHQKITHWADGSVSYPKEAVQLEEVRKEIEVIFHAVWDKALCYDDASNKATPHLTAHDTRFNHTINPLAYRITTGSLRTHQGKRNWLQKIAGTGHRGVWAVLDDETFSLPPQLALFPTKELNRECYLWLAAQAAALLWVLQTHHLNYAIHQTTHHHITQPSHSWLGDNMRASLWLLHHFPGWRTRYSTLLQAHLAQRTKLSPHYRHSAWLIKERIVQAALPLALNNPLKHAKDIEDHVWEHIGENVLDDALSPTLLGHTLQASEVAPVYLWVEYIAAPPRPNQAARPHHNDNNNAHTENTSPQAPKPPQEDRTRRRAEEVDDTSSKHGLLMFFRAESILSWTEFVKINRTTDDDALENASQTADDMDKLSLARDGQTRASRVKFDLDLPSSSEDDEKLPEADVYLPEWNYRTQKLENDRCRVEIFIPKITTSSTSAATTWSIHASLKHQAQQARKQIERLRPARTRIKNQIDGDDIDVDAYIQWATQQYPCHSWHTSSSQQASPPKQADALIYSRTQKNERDMCALLLADLSLSTEAWAGESGRVIDVIRDALYVYGHAMQSLGDAFSIWGFSSIKRNPIRLHRIKSFSENWNEESIQRIGAIKPGFYTRMGAAIRYATQELEKRPEQQKLLLLLTDGKPNDIDFYEGRFGIEDTRHAVKQAHRLGITPYAITIDQNAASYLPYIFGEQHYTLVHHVPQLSKKLTQVMAALAKQV